MKTNDKLTMAAQVRDLFNSEHFLAFTFEGGYAVPYGNKPRKLFSPGKVIKQTRNVKGRVNFALYEYPDKSQLSFKYHEANGTFVSVVRGTPKVKALN